jgi:hypothetical protein
VENCNKIKQLSKYHFTKGNQICVGGVAGKGEFLILDENRKHNLSLF